MGGIGYAETWLVFIEGHSALLSQCTSARAINASSLRQLYVVPFWSGAWEKPQSRGIFPKRNTRH